MNNPLLSPNGKIILFYNVENLFDIQDDPETNDNEYLPDAERKWNQQRYLTKIRHLAKVIAAAGRDLPVIVGLTEVENDRVLDDLIHRSVLQRGDYRFIHYESRDERGIDVAMLYRQMFFRPLSSRPIPVRFPFDPDDRTRDLLYVKGEFASKDMVHFFLNHWPSRREGVLETEPKRLEAARILKASVDGIFDEDPRAKIIIMGDFNDPPDSESISKVLGARGPNISEGDRLHNLAYQAFLQRLGTINHKGKWLLYDQFIVSPNMLESTGGVHLLKRGFKILKRKWMLFTDPRYRDKKPDKTYSGTEYHGGYSDHLPIFMVLQWGEMC